jgi:hypothetical protein
MPYRGETLVTGQWLDAQRNSPTARSGGTPTSSIRYVKASVAFSNT